VVEFVSALDAVRCAIDVQRGMVERNADVPPNNRIEFRIRVDVGNVIKHDGDIFGGGVNVAARLEAIAEPGGICVFCDAHRQGAINSTWPSKIWQAQLRNIVRSAQVF